MGNNAPGSGFCLLSLEKAEEEILPLEFTNGLSDIGSYDDFLLEGNVVSVSSNSNAGMMTEEVPVKRGDIIDIDFGISYPNHQPDLRMGVYGFESYMNFPGITASRVSKRFIAKGEGDFKLLFSTTGPSDYSLTFNVYKRDRFQVQGKQSQYSSIDLLNGALSWPYLHNRLWKQHRPFPTGIMNGEETAFVDHEVTGGRPFVQRGVGLPLCKLGIDPVSLIENPDELVMVKTGLGHGMVEKLEHELATDMANFDLSYTKLPSTI
jgi:hypothetical protein